MQNREMAREHPELKKNTISRFLHKRRLKKRYQKQARTLAKQGGKATQKTAVTTEKIACTVVGFIRRHPVGLLVFIGVFLLLVSMHSCMASMRMMKYEVHQKPIRANDAGSTPALRGIVRKPPPGSPCRNCDYWNGTACLGVCYRDLLILQRKGHSTSGHNGPMTREGKTYGIDEI